jgi:hypothetical protein
VDSSVEARLQEIFHEYESLLRSGEYYGAAVRLALIFSCLPNLDEELNREWATRLQSERLPEMVIEAVEAGMERDAQKILRILSIGERWNEDEILLVLVTREDLQVVQSYVSQTYCRRAQISLDDIDVKIALLRESGENRRSFKRAADLMLKNSELPIDRPWLEQHI